MFVETGIVILIVLGVMDILGHGVNLLSSSSCTSKGVEIKMKHNHEEH